MNQRRKGCIVFPLVKNEIQRKLRMKMKMEEFLRLLIKIDERLKNALQYKQKRRILHTPPIFYIYEKTDSQAKFIMNDLRKTNGSIFT